MAFLYLFQRLLPWKHNSAPKQSVSDNGGTVNEIFGPRDETPNSNFEAQHHQTTHSDLERQGKFEQFSEQTVRPDNSDDHKSKKLRINRRTISDAILGLSDGLTVPFALSAGLSSLGTTRVVILGGLAELVAGAISMGLGGFLGARSELESYNATLHSTRLLIENSPSQTSALVYDIFQAYELSPPTITSLVKNLQDCPERLLSFLMAFHHKESLPTMSRAYKSAVTLALSYFLGGLIPLIPYFIVPKNAVLTALWWSIGIMGITLLAFGYVKTCIVIGWWGGRNILAGAKGGLEMLLVGAAAASAAIGLVKAIERGGAF